MSITYIKRITGATNSIVQLDTSDTTAAALASGYITAQTANITALNDGEWTWETNDMILLSASDGLSWCSIDSTFATLSVIASQISPQPFSVVNGLTAHAGGGQGSALALTHELNRVTTVTTAGDSVSLPASVAGLEIIIVNSGANPMQVFGAGTDTINGIATATGVSQLPNSVCSYVCAVSGLWQCEDITGGFADGNLPTHAWGHGLTAHAGGTQAAALPLVAYFNNVTTVATAADSVRLPTSAAGMQVIVANNGAASMQVYGAGTDTINAVATATGVAQGTGTVAVYNCSVAGNWVVDVNSLATAVTGVTGTFNNLLYGATPVAQVDPASCTIAAVAGAVNHSTITIQLKDGSGTNMARVIPFKVYLATTNSGLVLQSAASTGYSVTSGGVVDPTGSTTITQGLSAFSSATGGCVIDLLDTGKGTGNLILMLGNGFKASAAITAGSYG